MRYWNLLVAAFALSILFGVVLDLAFVDERVLELWETRNRLFLRNRIGLLSGAISGASIAVALVCIWLFSKKSRWAPLFFLGQMAMGFASTFYYGPGVSTIWSSALSAIALYLGAFMSAIILISGRDKVWGND